MEYISTRGGEGYYSASDAIIKGLADDGGLFVPQVVPSPYDTVQKLNKLEDLSYKELAYEIMRHFISDFTEEELKGCIDKAYTTAPANMEKLGQQEAPKFDDDIIAPVIKAGGVYFLELFHGRTLAFKDMALSILPYLMKTAAKKKNLKKRILILAATSGDTGKAAMEGFKGVEGIEVIVFYPKGGVSKVQELQMVTQEGNNLKAIAINGNFDDCQTAVKNIFSDKAMGEELFKKGVLLSSANSINIGRLIPQIVYYFYGYMQLATGGKIEMGQQVNFCVPTGNFGNILAGYYAKKMGLPIKTLLCASNINNVLYDFFLSGIYDGNRKLQATISPSMDIIISSNLERLLYHQSGKCTAELMEGLKSKGAYSFDKELLKDGGFWGEYATEDECLSAIRDMFNETGYIMDTHTAVAYHCLLNYQKNKNDLTPSIITSTASPYKFPSSVMKAIEEAYEFLNEFDLIKEVAFLLAEEPPMQLRELETKEILHKTVLDKDGIKEYIMDRVNQEEQ